jgi:glycosyltransferase involved in cell wall biosynthesis
MSTKVILDGSLFSECELMGSNRSGMLRLTEDITNQLIAKNEIDISFANTRFTDQYDYSLRDFVFRNYPAQKDSIVPKRPIVENNGGGLRNRFKRFLQKPSLTSYLSDIEKNDIFHSFYYPFPKRLVNSRIKKSITFLDIIPLRLNGYPEPSVDITKKIVESILSNFAISISEFSREDLLDYDKRVHADRVFTAPLAASNELFFCNRDQGEWERVKEKYKLPENYFLSVSSNDHRKNIPHLIRSFSQFILQEKPSDLSLVLTGNFNYSYSILDELNVDKKVRDRIFITKKYIDNKDLSAIYSNALCFFFMSMYEGFGLPVLEAMQCGTPVVTSDNSSIPEVVGDSGIMLPHDDEDALCEAMNAIYLDESLREKYSQLGIERAKQFSWQRCASEYQDIFNKIALNN